MSYSDYTTLHKLRELGISHKRQKFFAQIKLVSPSPKLIEDLEEAKYYSKLRKHIYNVSLFYYRVKYKLA